jgi:hypothetical protein
MLSANHYEAIGRFTQEFNKIDGLIDFYSRTMLDPSGTSGSVAKMIVDKQPHDFGRRLEFFKMLLEAIVRDHSSLTAQVTVRLPLLSKTKDLTNERNTVTHGTPRRDPQTKKVVIELKVPVDCDVLQALTPKAAHLYEALDNACFEVFKDLSDIRAK